MRTTRTGIQAFVVASTLAVGMCAIPPAHAEPNEPAYPSQREVDQARDQAGQAHLDVETVTAELASAQAQVQDAAVRAEMAAEASNGARWQLAQARERLRRAQAEVRRADRQLGERRSALAGLVAASYQSAGDLSALSALMTDTGPEGLMSQLLAFEGASDSLDGEIERFTAAAALAETFRAEALEARTEQERLVVVADQARAAAVHATQQAEALAAEVRDRRAGLVRRLAMLQGISVRLAEQRQTALEAREQRRREEAAAAQAAAAQAQQQAQALQQAQQQPSSPDPSSPDPGSPEPPAAEPDPAPDPASTPVSTPPPPSGGAAKALAFARAQLGERYVWGAAGPDAWDCSGLTMGAWAAAGVSLPHYSAAQYAATTPITLGQLRPGDLVFWGRTPSSIHHVALYLGDGQIIHAPRTGRPVSIDSLYYWTTPTFFGRV